eukprot:4804847-Amphidinium_carterae.2
MGAWCSLPSFFTPATPAVLCYLLCHLVIVVFFRRRASPFPLLEGYGLFVGLASAFAGTGADGADTATRGEATLCSSVLDSSPTAESRVCQGTPLPFLLT